MGFKIAYLYLGPLYLVAGIFAIYSMIFQCSIFVPIYIKNFTICVNQNCNLVSNIRNEVNETWIYNDSNGYCMSDDECFKAKFWLLSAAISTGISIVAVIPFLVVFWFFL